MAFAIPFDIPFPFLGKSRPHLVILALTRMKNLIDYIPFRDALSRMQGMFTPVERRKMAICPAILVEITAIVLWEIHKRRQAGTYESRRSVQNQ